LNLIKNTEMGRYYQFELKNKSAKNINKVNQILKDEFELIGYIYDDGFEDVIFKSEKWLREEWNFVKNDANYKRFSFSHIYKKHELTFENYKKIREQLGEKIGYSQSFKISCPTENEALTAYKIMLMAESIEYQNMFKIQNTDFETLLNYIKPYINE